MIKFTEANIQSALSFMLARRQHDFSVPNVSWSWLHWEADLISVTKANFLYEFEIKVRRADFQADFSKRKHKHLNGHFAANNPKYKYGRIPNYFTYVAPIEAVPICIPDYAGLLVAEESRWQSNIRFHQVRRPKRIHSHKVSETGKMKMLRTLVFKYWNCANNLQRMMDERNILITDRAKR